MSHPLDQRRPSPGAFAASAWSLCVVLTGANLSTPLYPVWSLRWGISTVLLTVIFAAYVGGIIAALLLVGRLSDIAGRRRVLLPALGCAFAAAVVFWCARGAAWLVAARCLQGLAVGAAAGTATAALADYASPGRQDRAALIGTIASVVGLSLGPLIAGIVAESVHDPDGLVWPLDLVLIASSAVFVAHCVPRHGSGVPLRLRLQKIAVPAEIRATFLVCAGIFLCGWVATALFLALGPMFVLGVLRVNNHAIGGATVFAVFASSAAAQVFVRCFSRMGHGAAIREMVGGLGAMSAGMGLFLLALSRGSLSLCIAGGMLIGMAQGVSYLGSLAALQSVTPATRRGEVMAAYYLVGYGGVALLVPAVGFLTPAIGLVNATAACCVVLCVIGASACARLIAQREAFQSAR